MRRVLTEAEFTRWLRAFLPSLPTSRRERLAPRGDRPHRSEARTSIRAESLEGVDAPGHRAKPAGVRSTVAALIAAGDPQQRWNDWRDLSALRRRPLAGDACRVSRNGPRSPACRKEAVGVRGLDPELKRVHRAGIRTPVRGVENAAGHFDGVRLPRFLAVLRDLRVVWVVNSPFRAQSFKNLSRRTL